MPLGSALFNSVAATKQVIENGELTIEVNESSSIDEFQRWKVGVLKEYCSRRGLPISGKRKDELFALAYAATVTKLPCVISIKKMNRRVALVPRG